MRDFVLHLIENIILLSILAELLILLYKIIHKDDGKPLMVLIMLSTLAIRDYMLMIEGVKEYNQDLLIIDLVVIFLVFIFVNIRKYFQCNSKRKTNCISQLEDKWRLK